jgi:glucan phosphorylase
MYRQGYFTQTIDGDGRQRAAYYDSDFEDLPIEAGEAQGRHRSSPSSSRSRRASSW